ncbi:hypothetical protein [Roseovarius sp. MBR-6]|uniref:hypothetical protein n=1 Tax=Roseovarius sp. MBR-6 TaxID=3156459 RepID=UPI0033958D5E
MLRQSTPAAGPDRFRAEMAAFGLGPAQIDAMVKAAQGAAREDGIEVFAWCAPALRWFLAMASQWRRDGEGRALGAAETQWLQGLRARLSPHRREVSASNG